MVITSVGDSFVLAVDKHSLVSEFSEIEDLQKTGSPFKLSTAPETKEVWEVCE